MSRSFKKYSVIFPERKTKLVVVDPKVKIVSTGENLIKEIPVGRQFKRYTELPTQDTPRNFHRSNSYDQRVEPRTQISSEYFDIKQLREQGIKTFNPSMDKILSNLKASSNASSVETSATTAPKFDRRAMYDEVVKNISSNKKIPGKLTLVPLPNGVVVPSAPNVATAPAHNNNNNPIPLTTPIMDLVNKQPVRISVRKPPTLSSATVDTPFTTPIRPTGTYTEIMADQEKWANDILRGAENPYVAESISARSSEPIDSTGDYYDPQYDQSEFTPEQIRERNREAVSMLFQGQSVYTYKGSKQPISKSTVVKYLNEGKGFVDSRNNLFIPYSYKSDYSHEIGAQYMASIVKPKTPSPNTNRSGVTRRRPYAESN